MGIPRWSRVAQLRLFRAATYLPNRWGLPKRRFGGGEGLFPWELALPLADVARTTAKRQGYALRAMRETSAVRTVRIAVLAQHPAAPRANTAKCPPAAVSRSAGPSYAAGHHHGATQPEPLEPRGQRSRGSKCSEHPEYTPEGPTVVPIAGFEQSEHITTVNELTPTASARSTPSRSARIIRWVSWQSAQRQASTKRLRRSHIVHFFRRFTSRFPHSRGLVGRGRLAGSPDDHGQARR